MSARTLGGIGLTGGYDLGEDLWDGSMNSNLLRISNLVQAGVIDAVAAVPVSPAAGDAYILTAAPHQYAVAVYDNGAWVYIMPLEGWFIYNRAANTFWSFEGGVWGQYTAPAALPPGGADGTVLTKQSATSGDYDWEAPAAQLYRFGTFAIAAPTTGEILLLHIATDAFTLAANFAGTQVFVGTNPTATFVIDVKKNGASIGSITISNAGVVTLATSGGTLKNIAAGDRISLHAPAGVDATIAQIAITLRGVS